MIKFKLLTVILLFAAAAIPVYSQDVKPLGTTDDVKAVFESAKGKVMLVNFWATWCKPCVKEFPELIKLYTDYRDKGFTLVFVSLDVPEELSTKLKPFLTNQGVDFTTYYSTFPKPEDLMDFIDTKWQGAIPSTYIYDKEGNVKASIVGSKTYEQFEKEITVLLAE